ncbi:hypothetical protein [Moorena sp. SIO3I6]|uniref:hypothetical protein n=1 Tax=Moorena sp. SIO3I6 TaxID=2607831 RepID=UPI0013FBA704|nr:hypothetical protein [Moorena sp. SIO3I6]NEP27794.1 hypothetical protein [Moorena sp. SIO3I6]
MVIKNSVLRFTAVCITIRYTGLFSLLPLFPSWEGLGVGFCSLLPAPCSLKTQNFVPN